MTEDFAATVHNTLVQLHTNSSSSLSPFGQNRMPHVCGFAQQVIIGLVYRPNEAETIAQIG